MNLRGSSRRGVGVFSKVVIFLSKYSHLTHSLANAFLSCTCLSNNSKWCLHSFVSPSPCTALLLWCFLLNIRACIYCSINRWAYFREKGTLWNNFILGLHIRGWAYFREITVQIGTHFITCFIIDLRIPYHP